ncbi:MAG: NosD domain-containing protein [Actinomycetota bacterium]
MRTAPGIAAAALVCAIALAGGQASAEGPAGATGADMEGMGGMSTSPDGEMTMPASHLQSMIDATAAGATLQVPDGVYVGQVRLDAPITLIGTGRPVLDGDGVGSAVRITSPGVTVRGFDIRNTGRGPVGSPSGVMIQRADGATVQDVRIEDCYIGITVRGSEDVVIDGATIRGSGMISGELHVVEPEADTAHDMGEMAPQVQIRGDGIWLWNSVRPIVRDSTIDTVRDGIYLSYGEGAVLEGNTILDSRYAIHDMYAADVTVRAQVLKGNLSGIVLMYGGPVVVADSTIVESGSASTGFGILVKDAGGVEISRNVIADNRVGIHMDDAGRTETAPNRVVENTVAMNQIGVLLYPSADATFTRNGFVENSTQVTLGGKGSTQVAWTEDGVGNYWSDYGGFDAGGDGTGDLAYTESGRMSRLLAEEPLLIALASGPAFRLLSSVEDKWSSSDPIVMDEAPIVDPRGPALRGDHLGGRAPLWIPGLVLTVGGLSLLARARRPRRVVTVHA